MGREGQRKSQALHWAWPRAPSQNSEIITWARIRTPHRRPRKYFSPCPFLRFRKISPHTCYGLQASSQGLVSPHPLPPWLGWLAKAGFWHISRQSPTLTRVSIFFISLKKWKNLTTMVPSIQHNRSQEERRLCGNPRLDILSLIAMLLWVCL